MKCVTARVHARVVSVCCECVCCMCSYAIYVLYVFWSTHVPFRCALSQLCLVNKPPPYCTLRHLRYIGEQDMVDKNRLTLVRTCIDVGTSDNVVTFLQEMGFRLDYEFVIKGYLLRKGRMKVTLSRVFRVRLLGLVS